MFDVVTKTWNPIAGCLYSCVYCWARQLAIRKKLYPKGFKPQFFPERLKKVPKKGYIFVGDMADMWGDFIPSQWIKQVLTAIRNSGSKATFLFLTRNPQRYLEFESLFTPNMVLGITLETNRDYIDFQRKISNSPPPPIRAKIFKAVSHPRKFVSIEPILSFDHDVLKTMIREINPELVYIGYDNYKWKLPEPSLQETRALIKDLIDLGFTVHLKTLRPAWWE